MIERQVRPVSLVLMILAVLGLVSPLRAAQARPFTATGAGFIAASQGNQFTPVWTGQATHLGRYSAVSQQVIQGEIDRGPATFVAANGDRLTMFLEARFDPVTARFIGTYRITGGTGRFRGAAGSGSYVVVPNFSTTPVTFTISFTGTIFY